MVVFPGAKINIGLSVTGKRGDGYHNIETLFYPLGFSDILEVVRDRDSDRGHIDFTLSGIKVEGSAEENLVVRAYRLLQEWKGLPAVKVYLHKCIPTGAGLGGGSSDAACMLQLLNWMFELHISREDLFRFALQLGSDCPFFLNPIPSFARGRGEELVCTRLLLNGLHILLFQPGAGISTAGAYGHVRVEKPSIAIEEAISKPVSEWKGTVQNAFEPYAVERLPVIGEIKEALYRSGALYASMTGSGSAVYGLFDREPEIPEAISGYLIWKERF
ncbi:MAG: 4-(cytidine 5'-diphospho)-2-C-methyl-D-erythritol kinase [Bacteroidales bacterium]|nr:4-(cytidine 5'-diphospho)-2-C-methyl-D-erythritol kinase [Bacteroidales bacterium]